MKFFADQNVGEDVCRFLEKRGYEAVRLRHILNTNTPDPEIARHVEETGAVLVSHDRDFQEIAPRIPKGERRRFRRLSRIYLQCDSLRAEKRIKAAMSLIEFEWDLAQRRPDKRIHIVIQNNGIKTLR